MSVASFAPIYLPSYEELPYWVEYDLPWEMGTFSVLAVPGPDGVILAENPLPATLDLTIYFECLIHGTLDGWAAPTSPNTANAEFIMTDLSTEEVQPGGCTDFILASDDCTVTFYLEGMRTEESCF